MTPSSAILACGHRLGPYELLAPLAHGGMGAVWAARDRRSGAIVAVKTILPGAAHDLAVRTMFLDEARVAQLVRHPHVCRLLDFGNEAGTLYMVLEWVDGDSLRVAMKNLAPSVPPIGVALRVVRRVCDALHAAHELACDDGQPLGLVHRDVSPHNVLVGLDGCVKRIDFGIAKTRRRLSETTTSGVLKGKLRYMAPEQVENAPFDRRADVWSLGAVLHYLLGGEEIFGDAGEAEILRTLVMREPFPAPPRALPPPVRELLARSLAFDAGDRFPTATSAASRRAAIASATGALAPRPRTLRRRVALGAAIAAATSGLGLAFVLATARADVPPAASAEPIAVPAAEAAAPLAPPVVAAMPAPPPVAPAKRATPPVRPRSSPARPAKKPAAFGSAFDTHD